MQALSLRTHLGPLVRRFPFRDAWTIQLEVPAWAHKDAVHVFVERGYLLVEVAESHAVDDLNTARREECFKTFRTRLPLPAASVPLTASVVSLRNGQLTVRLAERRPVRSPGSGTVRHGAAGAPVRTARALMAGFVASAVSLYLLVLGFLFLFAVAHSGSSAAIALGLTHLGSSSADWAIPILLFHQVVGTLLAVAYAHLWQPAAAGPEWRRGLTFSLLSWGLFLAAVMAVTQWVSSALAGCLPLIVGASLGIHLCYGAVLGYLYGPSGDTPLVHATSLPPTLDKAIVGGACGLLSGLVAGAVLGWAILEQPTSPVGLSPLYTQWATVSVCAAQGALLGTLTHLPTSTFQAVPTEDRPEAVTRHCLAA